MAKPSNQIRKALRDLKSIKPDSAWKDSTKNRLMAELNLDKAVSSPVGIRTLFSISIKESLGRLAWQPIGGALVLFGLIVGPGMVTVNAAKGSLPGDALYPVKRSLERARISITLSNSKKAQLEVNLVSNRLHELQRITKEQVPSPQRQQNITLALQELKKDTDSVKTRLEAVKNEPSTTDQEVVNLAKIIDDKSSDYQQTLQSAVEGLDDEAVHNTGGEIGQALTSVQDVAINALDILVTKGADTEKPLSEEELKTRVQQQLDVVKKSVLSFRNQLDVQTRTEVVPPLVEPAPVEGETDAEVKTDVIVEEEPEVTTESTEEVTEETSTETETTETTETVPVIEETISTIDELTATLDDSIVPLVTQAEELLKLKDFSSALDTLNQANKKLDELSKQLQKRQSSLKTAVPVTTPTTEVETTDPTETETPKVEEEPVVDTETPVEEEPTDLKKDEPVKEATTPTTTEKTQS
jgi:hypothetical protein